MWLCAGHLITTKLLLVSIKYLFAPIFKILVLNHFEGFFFHTRCFEQAQCIIIHLSFADKCDTDCDQCLLAPVVSSNHSEADYKNKDWVFVNYTYKRFEGLTARGAIPSYMKGGKR